jgi:hypothetical protein
MDLIFIPVSHLVHTPLIDCGCRHTFLHPSQAGCATNARQRAAPQSPQERYVAIVMSDAARRRRRVRKFVAGRPCTDCATARKRVRQLRAPAHARPIRFVNEIADGKIGLDLASVISATQVSVHLPDQVCD